MVSYTYKMSGNNVLNASGTVVYTGANASASLNWALNNHTGVVVYAPAGTYNLTTDVMFPAGTAAAPTTLYGDGDTTVFTGTSGAFLNLSNVNYVNISSIKLTGSVAFYCNATNGTYGNWNFNQVHASGVTGDQEAVFWLMAGNYPTNTIGGTIDTVTFNNCTANNCAAYGFLNYGIGYHKGSTIRNVTYTNCTANDNGGDTIGWINTWITGFDVVELCEVEHIKLQSCIANGNLCSGIHIEYAAEPLDVVFMDCIANNNGQHAATAPWVVNGEDYYAYGFKVQNFQIGPPGHIVGGTPVSGQMGGGVTMIRCSGTGNPGGMTPFDPRTYWDMKVWTNPTAGNASTGTFFPAGAPTATSDIVLTKNSSNANINVDTAYFSLNNLYYYAGQESISTPISTTYATALTLQLLDGNGVGLGNSPTLYPGSPLIAQATLVTTTPTAGLAVANAPIVFTVTTALGTHSTGTVNTDTNGVAQDSLTALVAAATATNEGFGTWQISASYAGQTVTGGMPGFKPSSQAMRVNGQ